MEIANFTPARGYLVVRIMPPEPESPGALITLDAGKDQPERGEIVADGGWWYENGASVEHPYDVGDAVLLQHNAGRDVRFGAETLRLVHARDLYGRW